MKITKSKQLNNLPEGSIIVVDHDAYQNHYFKDGQMIWSDTLDGLWEPITSKVLIKLAKKNGYRIVLIYEGALDA